MTIVYTRVVYIKIVLMLLPHNNGIDKVFGLKPIKYEAITEVERQTSKN